MDETPPSQSGEPEGLGGIPTDVSQLTKLIDSITAVSSEIAEARKEVKAEREARERDTESNSKFKNTVLIFAGILILVLVGAGIVIWNQHTQYEEFKKNRTNALITSCNDSNKSATNQHNLWNGILLISPRPPDPNKVSAFLTLVSDTPEHRVAIDTVLGTSPQDPKQIAALGKLLDDTFPQRQCDINSINRYYVNGGK